MRYVFAAVLVGGGVAAAEPALGSHYTGERNTDVSLDIGFGAQRVVPGDGVHYTAEFVRFAPKAEINRHVYLGAAFSFGYISSAFGMGVEFDCTPGLSDEQCDKFQRDASASASGHILTPQVFLGVKQDISLVTAAIELAPTLRYTDGDFTSTGHSLSLEQTTVEGHVRADAWFTPYTSAGIYAGVDLDSTHNYQAGLLFSVHFYRHDRMQ
ncbi:MAG: hypothetical protein QM831_25465 [Kofleriaceae bacterium]